MKPTANRAREILKDAVSGMNRTRFAMVLIGCFFCPLPAEAYIGPGAGFAFVSSFFILIVAIALAFFTLLTWPLRFAFKFLVNLQHGGRQRVRRVVILGLDGQDPDLTEAFMDRGLMPNFSKLRDEGCFERLGTTLPAESPVAWSSFQTGCNPGKHRIYDFLVPNRKSQLPELSSAHVESVGRVLRIGKYRIPLGGPPMKAGRKSQPFWRILGKAGVFSSVVRVPITFPPEKFRGVSLSAMCVPDLRGSQGTYTYYTSNPDEQRELTSGVQRRLEVVDGVARGTIAGPENGLVENGGELTLSFELSTSDQPAGQAELKLGEQRFVLAPGRHSPWISLRFKAGLCVRVYGLCRFVLLEVTPHFRLYVTPIQIDPERPALPISHPASYSIYLAKAQGPFATLGVAEDTSALNEGIIDEQTFLDQCYDIHRERETMFFDTLDKTPRGMVCVVFDLTDRLQHMFFRYLRKDHPANQGRDTEQHADVIEELYKNMDALLGRVMKKMDRRSVLIVLSDHGFKAFHREVDLNAWLRDHGWLVVHEDRAEADMLQAVHWEKTRAYAVGFGGIYLNLKNREARGIVDRKDADSVKRQIQAQLLELTDERDGVQAVRRVFPAEEAYHGPYRDDAPDLVVGFRPGYRAAWRTVTGGVGPDVFKDNTRPWSGDHNMNPEDVPGILFCNRPVQKPDPAIVDIAPTVLDLLGVEPPSYMDGKSLFPDKSRKPRMKETAA